MEMIEESVKRYTFQSSSDHKILKEINWNQKPEHSLRITKQGMDSENYVMPKEITGT